MKRSWLDLAPLPSGVLRGSRFAYANQALLDLTGLPWEALEGRSFLERVAPEDRDRMRERNERRLRGEPVPDAYEFRLLRGDGARRTVEVWISADDGDIVFQIADRTDRALHQEKLAALAQLGVAAQMEPTEESLFEALSRGITEIGMGMARLAPTGTPGEARVLCVCAPGDLVERFHAVAGAAPGAPAELAGVWGPAADLAWREGSAYIDDLPFSLGRFFRDDPGGRAEAASDITRAAALDRGVMIRIDAAGRPAELLLLMAAFLLPEHLPACRLFGAQVSAALDAQRLFADLRESYADLARAQEQLVQRERLAALGELAAVVAHEVRNPLGVLFNSLGAFRKLLGDDVQGAARTLVEIMEEEAARLNHIVGDLLDFARPITPILHRERLDLILDEAVDAALGDSRGRVALVRRGGELPPVPLDARLIRQALLNLAANAVQAMPTGGTITLDLARDAIDGVPMARVSLADTGSGIDPEIAPRIFEPFFTTRATGTGLGLAVVKRIVDAHHGVLRVSSGAAGAASGASGAASSRTGTTFTLWLPLQGEETGRAGP